MVQDIVHGEPFFRDDALACEKKTVNHKIEEMFIADSVSTSHMVKSLKNIKNLQEVKTVVKTGKNKTMTGSIQGDWNGY